LLLILSSNAFINYSKDNALNAGEGNRQRTVKFDRQSQVSSSAPVVGLTHVINLPLIEQNAPATTPIPSFLEEILISDGSSVTETPTATATIFPQQTGATNLPITLGALIILGVIVLTWLIFGRQSIN
jgi:hypothetical protein